MSIKSVDLTPIADPSLTVWLGEGEDDDILTSEEVIRFHSLWDQYRCRLEAAYEALAEEAWWGEDQEFHRGVTLDESEVEYSNILRLNGSMGWGGGNIDFKSFSVPLKDLFEGWDAWYPAQIQRAKDAEVGWRDKLATKQVEKEARKNSVEYQEYKRLQKKYA